MFKNKLYCGDNREILPTIPSESVDIVYIDPPFFSNRNYEIVWGDEAEIRSFEDRWEGGIHVYIEWMKQRVMELYRVLKPTGSMYLHCDWHAGHYLKVMMDEVFGQHNFRNEIVWCYRGGGSSKTDFGKRHDNIFRYSKTEEYKFYSDEIRIPYQAEGIGRTDDSMWGRHKGIDRVYKPHPKGKVPEDWWQMNILNANDPERMGYPTQKPEALLERIIKASSKEGDIVLDAFCGCGTALAVAQKLERYWIGIDISPTAIALIKNRLANIGVSEKDIDIIGMPETAEDLKRFKPYEFQYWVINEMYATPSPRKSGDMGIDGFSFMEHYPIQVKQSEGIGRNVIDNFETALRRYYTHQTKNMKGYIVAFSFGKGAHEEVARVKSEGIEIELVTVQDILEKKVGRHQEVRQEIFGQEIGQRVASSLGKSQEKEVGQGDSQAPEDQRCSGEDNAPVPNKKALLEEAKAKGIRYFRVMNKEELQKVMNPKTTKEEIEKTIEMAKARWKMGKEK